MIYKARKSRAQADGDLGRRGLKLKEHLGVINAASLDLEGDEKKRLETDPDAEAVFPDREVHGSAVQVSASSAAVTANLNATGLTGQGIVDNAGAGRDSWVIAQGRARQL